MGCVGFERGGEKEGGGEIWKESGEGGGGQLQACSPSNAMMPPKTRASLIAPPELFLRLSSP